MGDIIKPLMTEPPLDPPEIVDPKAESRRRDQKQEDNINEFLGDVVANDPLCQILDALMEVTGRARRKHEKEIK